MVTKLSGPSKPSISGKTKQIVVFLHGYGADGSDLISLSEIFSKSLNDAEFFSPNAPESCGIVGAGFQWFPISQNKDGSLNLNAEKNILESVKSLDFWLNDILAQKNLKRSNVLLVGFSQGTMIALEILLTTKERFMGVVGFSGGYLGVLKETKTMFARRDTPVILIHGDSDPVVPTEMTKSAKESLSHKGFQVQTFICKGLGHGISMHGLERAAMFASKLLG